MRKRLWAAAGGSETLNSAIQDIIRWPANLIASGAHKRAGLSHPLTECLAESILDISPAPLLLILGG